MRCRHGEERGSKERKRRQRGAQSGTATAAAVIWRGGKGERHGDGGRVAMGKRDAGRDGRLMEEAMKATREARTRTMSDDWGEAGVEM